jgi:3-deoxy-D-manno-octulosonic-acid transferase
MLKLYQLLSYLFLPIIFLNLLIRIIKNKEDKKRYIERFGKTKSNLNNSKKTIWLHAASIGEFKSSDLIITRYHKRFNILVTTTTKSSADYIEEFYNDKVLHQYIPYDVPIWCSRFINYWKPNLVLWIESDIWPNILKQIRNRKIDCYYINARVSPNSFNKWRYLRNFYTSSLMTFNKIFAQSQNDLERIKNLTKRNVSFIGNLKLSQTNLNPKNIEERKVFSIMLASTHENEEEIIIKSLYSIIRQNKIKLFIAPRHPSRALEIKKILNKYNFKFSLENKIKNYSNDAIIINSFGNLQKYFNKSEIVILGGSFVSKGGHNPLEPASHGCAIISGNNVYNWNNIFNEMVENQACIMVSNTKELENKIRSLIIDKFLLEKYKKKALNFSNKNFFDNETLFKEIDSVIN